MDDVGKESTREEGEEDAGMFTASRGRPRRSTERPASATSSAGATASARRASNGSKNSQERGRGRQEHYRDERERYARAMMGDESRPFGEAWEAKRRGTRRTLRAYHRVRRKGVPMIHRRFKRADAFETGASSVGRSAEHGGGDATDARAVATRRPERRFAPTPITRFDNGTRKTCKSSRASINRVNSRRRRREARISALCISLTPRKMDKMRTGGRRAAPLGVQKVAKQTKMFMKRRPRPRRRRRDSLRSARRGKRCSRETRRRCP